MKYYQDEELMLKISQKMGGAKTAALMKVDDNIPFKR